MTPASEFDPLVPLADDFLDRHRRGERPSPKEYAARHPELAERIGELFPALLVVENLGGSLAGEPPVPRSFAAAPRRLGEYWIIRQVGHGGMGIVYEAVQESLGRHVALKVLTSGLVAQGTFLERFRREAQTAARLHHSNIVPVFGVGQSDGVHYYAMQFIQGQGFDRVLRDVRRLRTLPPDSQPTTSLAGSLLCGVYARQDQVESTTAAVLPEAVASHVLSAGKSRYSCEIARLGIQASEALYYAHSQGVLHRDIKPANLLLDAQGTLWVTDFGLAKADDSNDLTGTGDIVGTLRYLAPERLAGKGDTRSDVYGLGVTLYELLTLRPAFGEPDRVQLVAQLTACSPHGPRSLDPSIPRDLETIVLKAMAADPADRYQSAEALAEDLRRFLADRPIRARRTPWHERAWRWCRRNPVMAGLVAAVFATLLGGASAATFFAIRANESAERAKEKEREARENEDEARESAAEALRKKNEADALRVRETEAKQEAEKARGELKDNLYYAEMNLAGQASSSPASMGRVRELLENWRPKPGELDRRGWEWYYQRGMGDRPLLTLLGHVGFVWGVSWAPDGRRLATSGADRTVRVWDARAGRELAILRGHPDQVFGVCWSPDSRRLASTSDNSIWLWDVDTGATTVIHDAGVVWMNNVSWSPDGRRLANAGSGNVIRIWDAATGRLLRSLTGHKGWVYGVSWAPDSRRIASVSSDKTVLIWDADSGEQIGKLGAPDDVIHHVNWAPDGRRLVCGGGILQTWNVETKESRTLSGHAGPVSAVSWSPDGRLLASGGYDHTVRIWDAGTGQEKATFSGHANAVHGLSWAPGSGRVASAGADGTVKVWDVQALPKSVTIRGLSSGTGRVDWSPEGERLAGAGENGTIRVWDARTGREVVLRGHTDVVQAVSWHPDGHRLVSISADKTVRVWDVDKRLETSKHSLSIDSLVVSWSPDGRRVAFQDGAVDRSLPVLFWDPTKQQVSTTALRHEENVAALAWDPEGRRLACACERPSVVKLWDTATGKEIGVLSGHAGPVCAVCWSRDGRRLASGSNDGTIRVWDVQRRQQVAVLRGHSARVRWVDWCPDGRLASAGFDQTVKVWDVDAARETLTLTGHKGSVNWVGWCPKRLRLASGSQDGTVRIWDATPGYAEERSPLLLPELERQLKTNPRSAPDLQLSAEIHARQGQWDRAAADWVQARAGKDANQPELFQAGWWVAGPFAGTAALAGTMETEPDPLKPAAREGESVRFWKPTSASSNGCLDWGSLFPDVKSGTGRALLRVYSPRTQPVAALLGRTSGLRFWLNGRLVRQVEGEKPAHEEDEALLLTLPPGWSTLLFQARLATGQDRLALWLSAAPMDRVRALADRGQWGDAAALLSETLRQQPDNAEALLQAGRTFRRQADYLRQQGQEDEAKRAAGQARAAYEKVCSLKPDHDAYAAERADYLLSGALPTLGWRVLVPETWTATSGANLTPQPDSSLLASGKSSVPEAYVVTTRPLPGGITALRLELLPDPSLPLGRLGRAEDGDMHLDEFTVTVGPAADPKGAKQVRFRGAWADYALGHWPVTSTIDGNYATGWSVAPRLNEAHEAVFEPTEPIRVAGGQVLTITLHQNHRNNNQPYTIGRFRLSATSHPLAARMEQWRKLPKYGINGWTYLAGVHNFLGERQAALHVVKKAVSVPPDNAVNCLMLVEVLANLGEHTEARKWLDRAAAKLAENDTENGTLAWAVSLASGQIAREARDARLYHQRARWQAQLNRRPAALADFARAVELAPDLALTREDGTLLALRADAAGRHGDWHRAAADLGRAAGFPDAKVDYYFLHALVLQHLGDTDRYRKAREAACARFEKSNDGRTLELLSRTCVLAPRGGADLGPLVRSLEKGAADTPGDYYYSHWLGAVYFRAEKWSDSLRLLREAERLHKHQPLVTDCLFLALAHHRQGQTDQARKWLDKAAGEIDRLAKRKPADAPFSWAYLMEVRLLQKEAEELVRGKAMQSMSILPAPERE